jgi:hypothetical protein
MIIISAGCLIFGSLLGMRFRVAILPPAVLAVEATLLSFEISNGQGASQIIVSQILALAALQSGLSVDGLNDQSITSKSLSTRRSDGSQFSLTNFWRR